MKLEKQKFSATQRPIQTIEMYTFLDLYKLCKISNTYVHEFFRLVNLEGLIERVRLDPEAAIHRPFDERFS